MFDDVEVTLLCSFHLSQLCLWRRWKWKWRGEYSVFDSYNTDTRD